MPNAPSPLQLELFAEEQRRLVLEDASSAVVAACRALEQGKTVSLVRLSIGVELRELLPFVDHARCGFSRRPIDVFSIAVKGEGQGLWARPLSGRWLGWTEWGRLPT